MNKDIFEKYADKLLSAMKREGLLNKEVADIFDVPPSYMTNMGKHPEKISQPFMEKVRTWAISEKPLRGYKLPAGPDIEAADLNQQEVDRDTAEMKFRSKLAVKGLRQEHETELAEAVAESVNSEAPVSITRPELAAAIRKEYEAVHDEIKIVAHKNGKVDVSKLDPRTGALAAAELFFDESGAFHLTYKFKP